MAKKKKTVSAPCFETYSKLANDDARNRRLLAWLEDDEHRAKLYGLISARDGVLEFPSRDTWQREGDTVGLIAPRPPPDTGYRMARLVTRRQEIEAILGDNQSRYSNRVYAELGGGNFMLALDRLASGAHKASGGHTESCPHQAQRDAYDKCFPDDPGLVGQLSHSACQAAAIMALRGPDFDLAAFAEQAAVRFCQKLLGYSFTDHPLLETALGQAYRGVVYQVLGRHFVTDPLAIPAARAALGRLLARTSTLIDAYAADDQDALKGCKDLALPNGLTPVMKLLGGGDIDLNGEQRAVIAVGAAVGTVGNVQAAACIAVKALFADAALWQEARELAGTERGAGETKKFLKWQGLIGKSLAANPPIPFLPRLEVDGNGTALGDILLALGGGTSDPDAPSGDDALIWGLPKQAPHWCAGQALAWPLIVEIVRHVIELPGLAEQLDPEDASVIGLTKRWGFACESYPLTYQRDRRVTQSSLNVAMRLKSPVRDNADRVRQVIRSAAPRIEEALRGSRHVHFAWFELIESDSVLVLHTVYDGPFWAYVQHFALKVGDLFDELFSYIENPPPTPVEKFPNEFVAHIQRYDRSPAMGYFFSAYPRSDVARIKRDEWARP